MNIKKTLLTKRLITKNLTVFSKSGIPLTSSSNQDILQGGLLLAINSFVKESFDSELNQLKIGSHIIVFKHSQNLLGSIIFSDKGHTGNHGSIDHPIGHGCQDLVKERNVFETIRSQFAEYFISSVLNSF